PRRDAPGLLDPEALAWTASDGNVSAQLLAAGARRDRIVDHQSFAQRPDADRWDHQRHILPDFHRAGHAGGSVTLPLADRAVRLVAVADRPRWAIFQARWQAMSATLAGVTRRQN